VADSLGEAFVEVLADTSIFGSSLEDGVSDALSGIEGDVQNALSGIPGIADEAFSGVASGAEGAAAEVGSAFERASAAIQENLGKIAIGGAVAGASMEAFARRQRDTRVDARNLAAAIGITESEMMDLIASTSNATFPLQDVTDLMRIAAQRGLEGGDALQDFANFWDMIGDATGESGVALGQAGIALAQIGIGAGQEAEALDAFGFIMNNTTVEVGQFLKFVGKVGKELGENTPSIDEMAAALGAMEDAGMNVKIAQAELGAALKETEGDLAAALAIVGISEEAYLAQIAAVEGSSGAISGNADRFAEARTPIENMTAAIEAQLFRMPQLAEAASFMAAPLTALGPAAMGFTHGIQAFQMISGGAGKALGVLKTGFVKLGAVILANPIFLIGALLIGVAILIWKFRDEILEAIIGAWEWIKEATQAFWDFLKNIISTLVESVTGFFKGLADSVRGIFQAFWAWYSGLWKALFDLVRNIVSRIRDFVVNAFSALRDRAQGAIQGLRDGVVNILNNVVDFVKDLPARVLRGLGNLGRLLFDKGKEMIQGLLDGAKSLLKNIGSFFLDIVPKWIRGPFEKALGISSPSKVFAEIGRDTMAGFSVGVDDELRRVQRAMAGMGQAIPMDLRTDQIQASLQGGSLGGRSQEIQVTINNPVPEPASVSISREMRKLAATGVFDG
jgi:phage-related protein